MFMNKLITNVNQLAEFGIAFVKSNK